MQDRAHPLGDDDHRGGCGFDLERPAQPSVGAGIERREAIIEQVQGWSSHQRPGDREPLALTAREVGPTLVDLRRQLVRHRGDEVARLGDLERVPQLGLGRVLVPEPQVVGDRAAKEVCLLGNEPNVLPECVESLGADVDLVDQHGAAGRVVEARDQVEQRRLP